ncbi:MAG: sigma 54-interacting transcriptional regulator [Candidatus Schekmanbacteria bacterium]|nr:sigma 54-interacting transcriptional regulator [Candidatus Schekmanbacteria bacterium]
MREALAIAPIVVAAEEGTVELVAASIAAGATDFLVLGEQLEARTATLVGKLSSLFAAIDTNRRLDQQNELLRRKLQARFRIVGESPEIAALVGKIDRVAKIPRPVLITGERGTGKELVARAIHTAALNGADTGNMVTVNCAAFSDTLLENELFGHEKGAFTGAEAAAAGKFELADGGTLFLDEIAHMSLAFQQQILRVVEYGTFSRVGGSRELCTRARIISATNADLKVRIREGKFLPDLLDRLAFEVIEVPPLRQRSGDIGVLAHHFLDAFARDIPAFSGKRLSASALQTLERYSFPGNVRELKNLIERAAFRDTTQEITPQDLGLLAEEEDAGGGAGSFQDRLDTHARRMLREALGASGDNQAAAARRLGLSYHQFRYYHAKLLGPSSPRDTGGG